jgi:nuclear pore complex protein Nup98-Nup96
MHFTASTTGFGGFGQPQAQQGQQQPTGHVGIGGLINPTPPQGGIFGSTTGTTGFGSTSSPFGAKPAFGATTGTTGGLFGQKPATPFGQTGS